ncbi:hypothetical protein [Diaphorobacter aerolatus]|uniref:CobQ/CobB/MinD/ParA nucleotide binding domain-containing protein n=1 Tax=Diaphorobacter aerolatus TaxID=1288495 RepID=A0A7H0GJC0_9BURK|nr:hypothetical protein [Diaphorobacter aerolatus]QNP48386.1 hypothetical protein H9K75_20925 [Diaphorobacter aerolatus]
MNATNIKPSAEPTATLSMPHDKFTLIPISNEGGVGKSLILCTLIEFFKQCRPNYDLNILSGDINHKDLVKLYNAKSFDVRLDNAPFINSADEQAKVTIIDTPAAFIDIFTEVLGDLDTYLMGMDMAQNTPVFIVPVATLDKSIVGLSRLNQLFKETTNDFRVIFVLNESIMKANGKEAIVTAFDENNFVKDSIVSGKGTVVTFNNVPTSDFQTLLKQYPLNTIIEDKKGDFKSRILASQLKNRTEAIWSKVF